MKISIRDYAPLITIAGIIIIADQITKYLVHHSYRLGESLSVIPDFFNLTYVRNTGAAFGLLAHDQSRVALHLRGKSQQ